MDAAARLERRLIAARTKAALQVKKAKGEKTGGSVPFGFVLMQDGRHLMPHPTEHNTLVRILLLRQKGESGRSIARTLAEEGFEPRGASWNPGNLQVLADRWLRSELPPKLKADLARGEYWKISGGLKITVQEIQVDLPFSRSNKHGATEEVGGEEGK